MLQSSFVLPPSYILPASGGNGGADRQAYLTWLNDLRDQYGVTYETVDDAWALLDRFKSMVDGYLLFDYEDNSLNPATNLASINNAIVIEESIEDQVILHGLQQVMDARGKTEQWVFDNYWEEFRHDLAFEQSDTWEQLSENTVGWGSHATLRDYAIFTKGFVFFEEGEYPLRNTILSSLEDDSPVIGYGDFWNLGEDGFVGPISETGNFVVAANHSYNISTLAGIEKSNAMQQEPLTEVPDEENVHYVTLVWTDGDNPQWVKGALPFMDDETFSWWANENRGNFNMGWGLPATLIDMAPSVVQWYYDNASNGQFKDDFVVYGSGGYMYPSSYPESEVIQNAEALNNYMGRMDTGSLVVIDRDSINNMELWDHYTSQTNLDGIFYLDYAPYHKYNGKINWSNEKPIVSARYSLWDGIQSEAQISEAINNASTDVNSPNAYSMISVHAWSKTMDDVQALVDSFDDNVRVVTPEVFIEKIKNNVEATDGLPGKEEPGYVMYEDFEDGDISGWLTTGGDWFIDSGVLSSKAGPAQSYALAGADYWDNYKLDASVRLRGDNPDAGIAFRAQDHLNHYLLAIGNDGLLLWKAVNGAYTLLNSVEANIETDQWYDYSVSLEDNNIKVYLDATLIMEVEDSTFSQGKVGLRTCCGTEADFDMVKVSEPFEINNPFTMYHNDFEAIDLSEWEINNGTWYSEDGIFNGIGDPGVQSYAFTGDSTWTDYAVEVDVRLLSSGNLKDIGVSFRVQDVNNQYLLAIREWGNELYKVENGAYTSLGLSTTTNSVDTWKKITITVEGNRIRVLDGSVVVLDVEDSTFSSGKVGFRTMDSHAQFDMIKVTGDPEEDDNGNEDEDGIFDKIEEGGKVTIQLEQGQTDFSFKASQIAHLLDKNVSIEFEDSEGEAFLQVPIDNFADMNGEITLFVKLVDRSTKKDNGKVFIFKGSVDGKKFISFAHPTNIKLGADKKKGTDNFVLLYFNDKTEEWEEVHRRIKS